MGSYLWSERKLDNRSIAEREKDAMRQRRRYRKYLRKQQRKGRS